jgi:hypothetical protein
LLFFSIMPVGNLSDTDGREEDYAMKLTVTINSNRTDKTTKLLLVEMAYKGLPLPAEVVQSLRETSHATYKTDWAQYALSIND